MFSHFADKQSLRNLRNNLAEDGSSDVQYEIARKIFDDSNGK